MLSCSEWGRTGGGGGGRELCARDSSKKLRQGKEGNKLSMSLLIKPKRNYTVFESLHWFQALSYNGVQCRFGRNIYSWAFSPCPCHGTAAYCVGACFYLKQSANYAVTAWAATAESSCLRLPMQKEGLCKAVVYSVWMISWTSQVLFTVDCLSLTDRIREWSEFLYSSYLK